MKKILLISLALIIVLGGLVWWLICDDTPDRNGLPKPGVALYIRGSYTGAQVDSVLRADLGDDYGGKVSLLWHSMGGTARKAHGAYFVTGRTPAWQTARTLATGRQAPRSFTFNNVRFYTDIASRVGREFETDSAAFMAASDSVLAAAGFAPAEYAAAVFPDTYEYYWTDAPAKILGKMLRHRNAFWNDERRAKAAALGLTPAQVHTLASIVEEETNNRAERPVIARLYLNRLARGMMLQADPTVKYAAGDFSITRVAGPMLGTDSPYNTYRRTGLPPGPIRIAEAATVDAVLNAPGHSYLYMCASPDFDGTHRFAATFDQHIRNAAEYRRELDKRGL